MTLPKIVEPSVLPSARFRTLRARVSALPDQDYEQEVEAITRESLNLKSSDERTRLVCLIYGQTGEAPYEMDIQTVIHYRRRRLLQGPKPTGALSQ